MYQLKYRAGSEPLTPVVLAANNKSKRSRSIPWNNQGASTAIAVAVTSCRHYTAIYCSQALLVITSHLPDGNNSVAPRSSLICTAPVRPDPNQLRCWLLLPAQDSYADRLAGVGGAATNTFTPCRHTWTTRSQLLLHLYWDTGDRRFHAGYAVMMTDAVLRAAQFTSCVTTRLVQSTLYPHGMSVTT